MMGLKSLRSLLSPAHIKALGQIMNSYEFKRYVSGILSELENNYRSHLLILGFTDVELIESDVPPWETSIFDLTATLRGEDVLDLTYMAEFLGIEKESVYDFSMSKASIVFDTRLEEGYLVRGEVIPECVHIIGRSVSRWFMELSDGFSRDFNALRNMLFTGESKSHIACLFGMLFNESGERVEIDKVDLIDFPECPSPEVALCTLIGLLGLSYGSVGAAVGLMPEEVRDMCRGLLPITDGVADLLESSFGVKARHFLKG